MSRCRQPKQYFLNKIKVKPWCFIWQKRRSENSEDQGEGKISGTNCDCVCSVSKVYILYYSVAMRTSIILDILAI